MLKIPLILTDLSLGSAGPSRLMVEYRWYFLPLTFLMLGGAFYFTFSFNRKWLLVTAASGQHRHPVIQLHFRLLNKTLLPNI